MALAVDLYPAEVVLPDRIVTGARVMVTRAGRVAVWADVTGVAKVVYDRQAVDHSRLPERGAVWTQQRFSVKDGAGGTVLVNATRPSGCNCGGSSLRDLLEADLPA